MSFVDDFRSHSLPPVMLGAVQLGLNYGVANQRGKPDSSEAHRILETAWDEGIRVLDTAQAYGDSESVIADHLRRYPEQKFHVISKIAPDVDCRNASAIYAAAEASHRRLSLPLASIMLHNPDALQYWEQGLGAAMRRCVGDGIAETTGISVYTPEQFAKALEIPEIRVIQAPFNVLDRRLSDSGLLDRAAETERVVVLRSIFLQGLLLLRLEDVPSGLERCRPYLSRWLATCAQFDVSPQRAALHFARRMAPEAFLVVGCEHREQVLENIALIATAPPPEELFSALRTIPIPEEAIINPSMWHKQ